MGGLLQKVGLSGGSVVVVSVCLLLGVAWVGRVGI